jgi:hypothetical protein
MTTFRDHARAEKKCAASPGGTFFILLQALVIASPRPFAVQAAVEARRTQIRRKC